MDYSTCAAVESQLGGGVKFLDEELGQRYSVICVEGFVAFLPVQHQVVICVCIYREKENKEKCIYLEAESGQMENAG